MFAIYERDELNKSREEFDVIVGDLGEPVEGGPCYKLYTKSFYEKVLKPKLNHDGIFVTQAGPAGIFIHVEVFTSIFNTIKQVFKSIYVVRVAISKTSPLPTLEIVIKGGPSVVHVYIKRHGTKKWLQTDDAVEKLCREILAAKMMKMMMTVLWISLVRRPKRRRRLLKNL
ncbi:hypothetical protein ACLB2K_016897 [Fragaria x ananassa]